MAQRDPAKIGLVIYGPPVKGPGGSEVWWHHKTGVKTDIVIKSKVLGIFWKFFLRSMSVHLNIGFFQKNYQNSKIRDLEIFRAFWPAEAAIVTYIGVSDRFLRDSGNRIPAENATFAQCLTASKVNMVATCTRCPGTCKNLQNSVDMVE